MDEGDPCSTTIRVWVQTPIDESTESAHVLITGENITGEDDSITLTYEYAARDLIIGEGETMSATINATSKEDKTVLNNRGIEIYTVASYEISITGTASPVLSEMSLMLVENIE